MMSERNQNGYLQKPNENNKKHKLFQGSVDTWVWMTEDNQPGEWFIIVIGIIVVGLAIGLGSWGIYKAVNGGKKNSERSTGESNPELDKQLQNYDE